MDKVVSSAADAVADIPDGATLAVGGFGLCGIPSVLIGALHDRRHPRPGGVLQQLRGRRLGARGPAREPARSAGWSPRTSGRTRSSPGSTCPASWRWSSPRRARWRSACARAGPASPPSTPPPASAPRSPRAGCPGATTPTATSCSPPRPKPTATFRSAGRSATFVLEQAVHADFGLVRAWKGDRHGNLVFRSAARNFNPLCAMAGEVTVAEVEHLVEPGELDPDQVHLPGRVRAAGACP